MKPLSVLNRRERLILYITVGLFLFAIGFNFIISPIMAKNDRMNKDIEITKIKLKKYMSLLGQKGAIMSKYDKYSASYKISGGDKDALVGVLSDLETIARGADVKITDIRPDTTPGQGAYREVIIDLRVEGSINGYLKFMYDLESSLSLFKIKRYKLNVKQGSQGLEGDFSISKLFLD